MDTDTRSSGTRLFYQVKPSGRRKVLKMVPGKSIQTQTVVTSPVHLLTSLVTQSRASPSGVSVPPLSSAPLSQPSGLSCSSLTNPTSPVKPAQSSTISLGTHLVQVPAPVQPSTNMPSRKMVLVIPTNKSVNPQIIVNERAESNVNLVPTLSPTHSCVSLCPPTAPLSDSNVIRTFTKFINTAALKPALNSQARKLILRFPQRPNSPNKWVVEENGANSLSSSQAPLIPPTTEVLKVVTRQEQSNKNCAATQAPNEMETLPEFSVVMWHEKIFFRVKKKEPKTGAAGLLDLSDNDVCKTGKAADTRGNDEDSVSFVGCFPAQTGSRADRAGEKAEAPWGSSTQPASSREGPMPRNRDTQMSSSSPTPCPVADYKLKQMFGITSEVEIRLPRVVHLHTGRSLASQVPPLDYTKPIEEDFLCDATPPHSQDCPEVEATSSRVGRTRKRTKCLCCSPAALLWHGAYKRRSKPGDQRETARKQLRVSTLLIAPKTDSLTIAVTTQKLVELMPSPPINPFTFNLPAPLTTHTTITPETSTLPMTIPVTAQKLVQPQPAALTLHTTRLDVDCEEIHREIQLLREALRLKEEALEKRRSHKNT